MLVLLRPSGEFKLIFKLKCRFYLGFDYNENKQSKERFK